MLRLLPISLLLVLLATATAQAATVKVPVPPEGQVSVAVASVAKRSSVKAKAPSGIAVTGAAKKGRLAVAVMHRRGVAAGGVVTLKVKGKVRGLKIGGAPGAACKSLAALLTKPLQSAGLAAADLRAAGAAAGARACGKPFSQALFDRLGLGAPPPASGGLVTPGGGRPAPSPGGGGGGATNQCANGVDDDGDGQVDAPSERRLRPDPGCMNANDRSEAGEVPLTCNAGAGVGDDKSVLQIGSTTAAARSSRSPCTRPRTRSCATSAPRPATGCCVIAHGHAYADTRNAIDAEMADLTIGLTGDANCAVPATIVLTRRNFEVAELVTPIARCGQARAGVLERQGRRRRRRGRRARCLPAHPADPDPGCSSSADDERGLRGRPPGRLRDRRRGRRRRRQLPRRRGLGLRLGHGRVVQAVGIAAGLRLRDRRSGSSRAR